MEKWLKPLVVLLLVLEALDRAASAFMDKVDKIFDAGSIYSIFMALLLGAVAFIAFGHWHPHVLPGKPNNAKKGRR